MPKNFLSLLTASIALLVCVQTQASIITSTNGLVEVVETESCLEGACSVQYDVFNLGAEGIHSLFITTNIETGTTAADNLWSSAGPISRSDWAVNFASIGLFDDLFGPDDLFALHYFCSPEVECSAIDTGNTDNSFFYSNAIAGTQFIALGANGQIIAQSFSAVPEPATLSILLLGLLGMGFSRKH